MRYFKFAISLALTVVVIYLLNIPVSTGEKNIPPLMKLLNPFTGFWQNADAVGRQSTATFKSPQLKDKVKVLYDERMVPHIFAKNTADAFFVQGFITAQNRLWQMDITTRATSGRLAEILGERLLQRDKLQRRKGLVFAAENALKGWESSPEDIALISAYTAGVNAFLNSLKPACYPLEFKLMNYKPEPWTNLKSAILIKSMAQTLCEKEDDLEATNTLHALGRETFDFLFPEYNPKQSPVIPVDVHWDFEPLKMEKRSPVMIGKTDHRALPKQSSFLGSNNWAVSGSKTAGGNPILCNDPHLSLSLPSIWYEAQIHTPEFNVYGVTLPGFPGVIIGFNENVSWGMTNVSHDVLDWYRIKWANPEKTRYFFDDGLKDVNLKIETFYIKGGKTVTDTVRYTHWGPVVYESPQHPQQDMAMRWIAHDSGSNEIQVLQNLSRAKNFDDFEKGIGGFHVPAQNLVFASREGDIALKVQGKFPLKHKEQGRFVMDGSNSANAWYGFVPDTHNPQVRNPARGFVSSANQHSTTPDYPYYYNGYFEDFRSRFLNEMLDSLQNITVEDMMKLQNSNFSKKAEEALPVMLRHLDRSRLEKLQLEFVEILENWDFSYDPEKPAPVLFEVWFDHLYLDIWDEFRNLKDSMDVLFPETWRTIALMEDDPENIFFDNRSTSEKETLTELVNRSFAIMFSKVDEWKNNSPVFEYQAYRQVKIPHLGRIAEFGSQQLPVGGDGTALNAIKNSNGPSWRMVVELGNEINAYGVYPGGQSGNPGSPFYDNMIGHWVEGKYYKLVFMKSEDAQPERIVFAHEFFN